jgi:UDP-glucuronate 4-epimerase
MHGARNERVQPQVVSVMKILVTGAAGFIGSAIAQRLSHEGHEVVGVDNFNEYYDVTLKRARAKTLIPGIEIVESDITDKAAMERLFTEHHFDAVAHLAAQAGVRYSLDHPEAYVATNVVGTQTLLQAMKEHDVRQIVFASTSSVYGNTTALPFSEEASADRPVSIYAATKRSCELMLHTYAELFGFKVTCLRFFTVYGPWGRPDMALFKFTNAMLRGEPIDVYNNGEHRRDFTYIGDIVDGFVRALQRSMHYEIINLGNNAPVDLMEYIHVLEKELGITAQMNMLPMQEGDVKETYADITKARTLLGYQPATKVEEGVANFVKWFRDFYDM